MARRATFDLRVVATERNINGQRDDDWEREARTNNKNKKLQVYAFAYYCIEYFTITASIIPTQYYIV